RLERFFDEIIGAALDRRDRGLDVTVAGDHHDRYVDVVLLDLLEQLQTVELGALQPDVEEHEVRATVGDLGQRRIAVARGPCGEAFILEDARNEVADVCFVVDNQNVTGHGLHLSCQLPVAASILASSLVALVASLVSEEGVFVSAPCFFVSAACVAASCPLPSAFGAWPETAKRSRIQAP